VSELQSKITGRITKVAMTMSRMRFFSSSVGIFIVYILMVLKFLNVFLLN